MEEVRNGEWERGREKEKKWGRERGRTNVSVRQTTEDGLDDGSLKFAEGASVGESGLGK